MAALERARLSITPVKVSQSIQCWESFAPAGSMKNQASTIKPIWAYIEVVWLSSCE